VLMKKYWNQNFSPEIKPWHSISVAIPEAIQEKMERLLLTLEDVQQAIYLAESEQCAFIGEDGIMYCRYVGKSVTVWVSCRKNDCVYNVENVYCHRMHFREGEQ